MWEGNIGWRQKRSSILLPQWIKPSLFVDKWRKVVVYDGVFVIIIWFDVAALFSSNSFRTSISTNVIGVEIGGAVKNVIALVAGMWKGLVLGTNALGDVVTSGFGEMRLLHVKLGAQTSIIAGLSGPFFILCFFFKN